MHETLKEIRDELNELKTAIDDAVSHNAAFGQESGNWTFPGLSKLELRDRVSEIVTAIDTFGTDKLNTNAKRLALYPSRIKYLIESTVPNLEANAGQAVPTLIHTLDGLERALRPNLDGDPNKDATRRFKNLSNRLRSREAQLNDIAPKLDDLEEKINRIENAHAAADQLPTDLQALKEARASINQIQTDVEAQRKLVDEASQRIENVSDGLKEKEVEANSVLKRCETAYSAATSVGLAAAFSERSKALNTSVWVWTIGLIAALTIAGWLGFVRINELATAIADTKTSDARVALQFLLSALTVGAPIWFAWLATRQIGQRFRIAEDYAFKASVSQAYEGYRREAARIDQDMEQQLLGSALSRLDEQPLRLVEEESHSSPLNEMVSSPTVKKAIQIVPNFGNQVKELAKSALARANGSKDETAGVRIEPDPAPDAIRED